MRLNTHRIFFSYLLFLSLPCTVGHSMACCFSNVFCGQRFYSMHHHWLPLPCGGFGLSKRWRSASA